MKHHHEHDGWALRSTNRLTPFAVSIALIGITAGSALAQAVDSRLADAAMRREMSTVRALIREGADPNAVGAYGTPALVWVVRVDDLDTAELLLDAGADPDRVTGLGLAPLHLAVRNGNREIVELLLAAGADPNLPDRSGETSIFLAAAADDAEIAQALIAAGAEVDFPEPVLQQTALHVAARHGSVATARLLLAAGADVSRQTSTGEISPFRLPAENAGSKGVGIVRGGWPDHGMRYAVPGAKTPLLYASRRGDLALVELLVEVGADVEQADGNGIAPLLNAILNASVASAGRLGQHLEVADYLLAAGADPNAADWYGQTPLWAAVDLRNLDLAGATRDNGVDRVRVLALIERLLAAGSDVNARTREYPPERRFITRLGSLSWVDFTGQTPFLRAALAGDTTVMKLLLAQGADPNIATFEGTTPLMAAAGVNWVVNQTFDEGSDALLAAVALALDLGNDVNAANSMGVRAIHGAANRGSDEIIQFLAQQGAELDVADREGRTPLAWAAGVFLATHPPVAKPDTIALLEALSR
jgi:ankyrin repeat protein